MVCLDAGLDAAVYRKLWLAGFNAEADIQREFGTEGDITGGYREVFQRNGLAGAQIVVVNADGTGVYSTGQEGILFDWGGPAN